MNKENQEVPKWMEELEEKREKRLKARLGHEAGAGSRCLTCEDKCPGLDLHFWRKICKNCKCGKESHDVNDDDVYGWIQFQLLGSKPNKSKKITLPGCKDAVELEWTPKGPLDVVESYLKELPVNLLPIKGSPAAQERKKLLQKQIPLHDVDPSLCHALSESEVNEMNVYIHHLKQNSVGLGHIYQLNEIVKRRSNFPLKRAIETLKEEKALNIVEENLIPFNANNINDIYCDNLSQNEFAGNQFLSNLKPQNWKSVTKDFQTCATVGDVKDIQYPLLYGENTIKCNEDLKNLKILPNYVSEPLTREDNVRVPTEYGQIENIYPDLNINYASNNIKVNTNQLIYPRGQIKPYTDEQKDHKFGNIRDLAYSTYDKKSKNLSIPNELNLKEENVKPLLLNVGSITDIEYEDVKKAVQTEAPTHKIVTFDSQVTEILPPCHKCQKLLDENAIVIGIDKTDSLWHTECFQCCGCNQSLADLIYFYDKDSDDVYCGRDYAKTRGIPRCQACDELIFVKEYCLAENSTFHVKHFCCYECDEPLAGQNYLMEDFQPLCLPCFEKIKAERCSSCNLVIKPHEQGAVLKDVHFHANDVCFSCKMCKKALLGTKFLFKHNSLYCSVHCFTIKP